MDIKDFFSIFARMSKKKTDIKNISKGSGNLSITFDFYNQNKHSIDAVDLSFLILRTSDLLGYCAKIVHEEIEKPSLEVKAVKKGSFALDMVVSMPVFISLFTENPDLTINTILDTILKCIEIKKHLLGKPYKEIKKINENDSVITNVNGDNMVTSTKTINQYFTNANIENCVINIFTHTPKDVKEVVINDFTIPSGDFQHMKEPTFTQNEEDRTYIDENANLHIITAVYEGNASWEFKYQPGTYRPKRIMVKIEDATFLEEVQKGKKYIKSPCSIIGELKKTERVKNANSDNEEVIKEYYVLTKFKGFIP